MLSDNLTDENKRFLHAQQAVENVMHAHIHTPLPVKIRLVGQGYILDGSQCIVFHERV